MRVIIPMAGMGKRLRPHTLTIPKPLLPIAGKPIVQWLVEDIAKVCSEKIDEIAYVIGDFGREVEARLKDIAKGIGAKGKIYYQDEALGTAHAIFCAEKSLKGKIIIAFADTLFKADFTLDESQDGTIWVKKIKDPNAFGVVCINNDNIITGFVEKPEKYVSDLAIIGIYYFKDGKNLKKEIQYIIDNALKDKGEYQLTTALENMKEKGIRFTATPVEEWLDCGNKNATVFTNQRILELNRGNKLLSKTLKSKDSTIAEPCYIGENVQLINSIIGPYVSIGDNTIIENSHIENSIIQTNSKIYSANMCNSMLGNFVEYRGEGRDEAKRDVSIGDYSMIKLIIFGILLSLFSSCNTLQHSGKMASSSVQQNGLSEKERVDATNIFFNANKEKLLGNDARAAALFSDCIRKDPSNAAAMYELSRIYGLQGKREEALFLAKKAAAIEPGNVWYQLILADSYKKLNLFDEAVSVYEQLIKNHPARIDFYNEWANTLLYMGKNAEAIEVYNKMEEQLGVMEEISFQKEHIYIKLNKVQKAIEELEKLIITFPGETKYYGMLAELYQANGFNDKAMETYRLLLEMNPDDPITHLSLADYYFTLGEKEKSFDELKFAFSTPNLDLDTKIDLLLGYYTITNDQELKEQALALCKTLVKVHPGDARPHSIYGDFLYREKQLEAARDQYRLSVNLAKDRFSVHRQLLAIEAELGDFDAMLQESNEAIELFPNQAILYLFNGIANIQLLKYQEAIEILNKGVGLAVDNEGLLADFYSRLGDTYHTEKDMDASDKAYEKALEINPDDHFVLNNYSYYLSLRRENLKKAKKMSEKANSIEPGNVSFQDTYGWILYQMGNYPEAKIWLEKAIENGGGKKGVIVEHYGDILFKSGEKDKAVEYWNKAIKLGRGSELLDKKIADKKLYE